MLDKYTFLIIPVAIIGFLVIGNEVASRAIKRRQDAGKTLSEIKEEFEIRKSIFVIIGGISILFGAVYSFYEFGLKLRAEDRLTLYGALGQLIEVDDKRPEISAAALLQLDRLGASSDEERPALVQIVTAYLNERARKPVVVHDASTTARPDIQMAVYVLSRLLDGDHRLGRLVLLKEVDLRHIRIDGAQLVNVKMIGVDLGGASMPDANLSGSDLTGSKFKEAVLRNTNFNDVTLDYVDFEGADLSAVNFCDVRSRKEARLENLGASTDAKCLNSKE